MPAGGEDVDAMPIDVVTTDEYVVAVDLPGFGRDDVDVRVNDDTLRVTVEREREFDEESAEYVRRERRHERAPRCIELPEQVDASSVSAKMDDGVLAVRVPRAELAGSREIERE